MPEVNGSGAPPPSVERGSIKQLDSIVVDQIAAGEVVERPASVAKELLENAVDAGAENIQVDIDGGGATRLVVTDDGIGVPGDELVRAVTRHATSKVRTLTDLDQIGTMGFRGEALASIASVSRFNIASRVRDTHNKPAKTGESLSVIGGKVGESAPVGMPSGTSVEVADLFYNAPARRKFLRSLATEQAHVVDTCLRVALGKPGLGLVLTSGSRRLLDIPQGGALDARVLTALGKRVRRLYPLGPLVSSEHFGMRVSGFISGPEVARGNSRDLFFFVNGRFVKDRTLHRAFADAYGQAAGHGRFPVAVVYLECDLASVDVNVHPRKLEVRFSDSGAVFGLVSAVVARAVATRPWENQAGEQICVSAKAGWGTKPASEPVRRSSSPASNSRRAAQSDSKHFTRDTTFSRVNTSAQRFRPGQEPPQKPLPAVQRHETPQPQTLSASADPVLLDQNSGWVVPFLRFDSRFVLAAYQGEPSQPLGGFPLTVSSLCLIDLEAMWPIVVGNSLRRQAGDGGVKRQSLVLPEAVLLQDNQHEDHFHAVLSCLGMVALELEQVGPEKYLLTTLPRMVAPVVASKVAAALAELLKKTGPLKAGTMPSDTPERDFIDAAIEMLIGISGPASMTTSAIMGLASVAVADGVFESSPPPWRRVDVKDLAQLCNAN